VEEESGGSAAAEGGKDADEDQHGQGGTSGAEKAKIFLEKHRVECSSAIRDRIGSSLVVYNSIQASNKRYTTAMDLLGGKKSMSELPKGVVDIGDRRILSGGLKIDITDRKVVSTSFDDEWRCIACCHNPNRAVFKPIGCAVASYDPQVILLADQSIPAVLPTTSEKNCCKIMIVECGTLKEIVDEFIKKLGNRRVPKGSAFLIFSGTHLAEFGRRRRSGSPPWCCPSPPSCWEDATCPTSSEECTS
jgi:hypothetical protein